MINKKTEQTAASNSKFDVTVTRAREIKKAEKEQVIAFDVNVNGVTIYGMIYRSGVSQKGKDYELISFPARKGTDDTYYNHVWFPISRELQAAIIEQISNKLTA
jgi:DNA-binding cell septation regulator SpoVG